MTGFRNDSYMQARLGRWGVYKRWHMRTQGRGGVTPKGFFVSSWWGPMILAPKVQGSGGKVPIADEPCPVDREEAQLTERCVGALPEKLRETIIETYIRGGTVDQMLLALRCCRWSYYTWLYKAYDQLMGYFNDVECGVPLPVIGEADAKRLTVPDDFPIIRTKLA